MDDLHALPLRTDTAVIDLTITASPEVTYDLCLLSTKLKGTHPLSYLLVIHVAI